MSKTIFHFLLLGALTFSQAASAEPIKLKLSFFTSDRSSIYQNSMQPFVDAVNEEGRGLIEIDVQFRDPISKTQQQQPQLVADGVVDMAIIVPGLLRDRFYDTAIAELPGLYRTSGEASAVYTKLIAAGVLGGYSDFYVIGAFVSEGEMIHSRKPVASIADLAGLKIRTNNVSESAALTKLGAVPVLLAINQTNDEISRGGIDGAALPPAMIFEFGIGRITSHHYLLRLGGAPTALVMNRKVFDGLPPAAQAIIRKYSGRWLSDRSAAGFDAANRQIIAELKSDHRRHVVSVSPADAAAAQKVYKSVIEEWAGMSAHNRELLGLAEAELAKLRRSHDPM
jgi:TRAP-type C4-dicarboxylate transport system substrate-binding protein